MDKLVLITNPGSSSRKYALYKGNDLLCSLHFEFEGQRVICTVTHTDGTKEKKRMKFKSLNSCVANLEKILVEEEYLGGATKLDAIVARTAAPGEYFSHDHLVDEECLKELESAKKKAPLHIPTVAREIEHFVMSFHGVPIVTVSDSGFHNDRPDLAKYYAIDPEVADQFGIKRWGFHGLSVGSIVEYMKEVEILPEKLIVCHIGSGSSVTAVYAGKSHDTTMGYTPLEGVMMSTRSGSIDVAAALAIKRNLRIGSDTALEKYLNKKAGLLGVSGKSDDMREILKMRNDGDKRGVLAHSLYVYRLQSAIGQMAASLGGVDAIVYTATIGERSDEMRRSITQKLTYLGFAMDEEKNLSEIPEGTRHMDIAAAGSKPIYVIKTDEAQEMIRRAYIVLEDNE